MAKILSVVSRAGLARILEPVARTALRVGITPNVVTVTGTVGVLIGSIGFAARGHVIAGLVITTLCALTDLIDGTMARIRGCVGRFGALLDSTMDRVADGAIFGSLAYWFATTGHPRESAASLICLVAGLVVSYVKARAEGLGIDCNVGIAERPERLLLVGIGALLYTFGVPHGFEVVLWLLAGLSLVTVGQRIVHVYRRDIVLHRTAASSGSAASSGGGR